MKRLAALFLVSLFIIVNQSYCCAEINEKDSPRIQAEYHFKQFQSKLNELANWCADNQLPHLEKITRDWTDAFPSNKICLYEVTSDYGWDKILPPCNSEKAKQWREQFIALRTEYSDKLYLLARKCSSQGYATYAVELYMLALRENPQNVTIRKIIGNVPFQNRWATRFEIKMIREGKVDHSDFGWIPQSHVAKYERGYRYYKGRWMSKREEARLRREGNDPWLIITPHYRIYSYPSLEEGVELGRKLETLAIVWNQVFLRFYATDSQLKSFFRGESPDFMQYNHTVVYFRDNDQYIKALAPKLGSAAYETAGIYKTPSIYKGVAYFYAEEDSNLRTVIHEATHQLFAETRAYTLVPTAMKNCPAQGLEYNYWVIEGIAMFMESLKESPGLHELGDFRDINLYIARYYFLRKKFYIPFEQFTAMGYTLFHNSQCENEHYRQATGVTWFLLFYDNGKYRDAFIRYLSLVYSGLDKPETLSELTGVSYSQLDKEYKQFMLSTVQPDDEKAFSILDEIIKEIEMEDNAEKGKGAEEENADQ